MSNTIYDVTCRADAEEMITGVSNLLNALHSTPQTDLHPQGFPKKLMITLSLKSIFMGSSEDNHSPLNIELLAADQAPVMVEACIWC